MKSNKDDGIDVIISAKKKSLNLTNPNGAKNI